MMSSEESGTESSEDIYVINLYHGEHPGLQDHAMTKFLSAQSKHQMKKRKTFQLDRSKKANFLQGPLFD